MTEEQIVLKLRQDFIKSFDEIGAENAFGDAKLIKLLREIQDRVEILTTTDPCQACGATGHIDHDCSCEYCTTEFVECERCFGTGRIEKDEYAGKN